VPKPNIRSELEKARRHLLELSTRNRLLNIPQSDRAKLIRVIDERSEEVYRNLVKERKKFTFLPMEISRTEKDKDIIREEGYVLPQPDEDNIGVVAARHRDTKLQTTLSSNALQGRLLTIHTEARTYIEEQGVNILYLAMGQLKWYEDDNSDIERIAPILLVPVRLERSSVASKFRLEALEEDPSDNLTLIARMKEFGIELSTPEIDEDFSPSTYFKQVSRAISNKQRWAVLPDALVVGFFSFSKFLMYRDLDAANWTGDTSIDKHELITALMRDGFGATADIINEKEHLDTLIPVDKLNHVQDADSSQALAIEEVRRGRDLIIQGPPGTGKSQTIVNLIATAVLDGKTVLFVAEKMAALEVVQRRLDEIKLGPIAIELHSHKISKKAILNELKQTLELLRPSSSSMHGTIQRLEQVRKRLNEHAALLNTVIEPCGLTPFQIIGNLACLDQTPSKALIKSLKGAASWNADLRFERENMVKMISHRFEKLGAIKAHPWHGVQTGHKTKFQLVDIHEQVTNIIVLLEEVKQSVEILCREIECTTCTNFASTETALWLAKKIIEAPEYDKNTIDCEVWQTQYGKLKKLITYGLKYRSIHDRIGKFITESAWETDLTEIRKLLAAYGHSMFRIFRRDYRRAVAMLKGILNNPRELPCKATDRLQFVDELAELQACRNHVIKKSDIGAQSFGALWQDLESDWIKLYALIEWFDLFDNADIAREVRRILALGRDKANIRASLDQVTGAAVDFTSQWKSLETELGLDMIKIFDQNNLAEVAFEQLRDRLDKWSDNMETLSAWIQYWCLTEEARKSGLGEIVKCLELGITDCENAINIFYSCYYRVLYDDINKRHPELKEFDGDSHDNLVLDFRKLDQTRIELARVEVLAAHCDRKPHQNGAVGALGIVLSEIAKKRRHMSIRRLISFAGSAVQAIKPVFMMSPLSVAQFLEPGKIFFDLVIFDEASQIKPVDALGAIARGRQLVIVGDSKQLPPSNFFAYIDISDDEQEDEEIVPLAAAGDMESILTLAGGRGLSSKMLRWHYRSRHSSLIAVSNYEFYNNRLFIVPSPLADHPEYGLKYHYVKDAIYNRGGRRQDNKIEAQTVAQAVMRHAREHPKLSLGVASFSVSQRDAILDELELLRREDTTQEPFFVTAHPNEPFFIKNLENVQGDERDVIFISVGYGYDSSGFFGMNFGPINKDGGERRLNVLISRAKTRCEVFTSIHAEDIDLSRSQGRGVAALKTFLKFAESGILGTANPNTGRDPDSPFEEAVKAAIEGEGYTVHAQVGVAGFYIDLAVVDPEKPGRYILGIECDGATYHSSRSARERDKQRQAVLEDHGWTIHRIWSYDWFLRPQQQLAKVRAAIEYGRLKTHNDNSSTRKLAQSRVKINWSERETAETNGSYCAEPYEEFSCKRPRGELIEASTSVLAEYVYKIVETEGPVHVEEVLDRMRTTWGLGRAGNRVQDAVKKAVNFCKRNGRVVMRKSFLSLKEQPIRIRDRNNVKSNSLKRYDHIPIEEITEAVCTLVVSNHGVTHEEIAPAAARLLGIQRTTVDLEQIVRKAVNCLIISGRIRDEDGFLRG
jgi:very-short-patch-repair endonuclease